MALDLDVFYNRPYTLNETVNFRAGSPEELESIQNLLEGFQTLELDEEDPVTGVGFKGNDIHLEGDGTYLDENGILDPFVLLDLIINSKWHSVKSRYEDETAIRSENGAYAKWSAVEIELVSPSGVEYMLDNSSPSFKIIYNTLLNNMKQES